MDNPTPALDGLYCERCTPSMVPAGPRIHEGHFAIRFGDKATWIDKTIRIYLNGEEQKYVFEVFAGTPGWIWRWAKGKGPHGGGFCPTCMGLLFEYAWGLVEVSFILPGLYPLPLTRSTPDATPDHEQPSLDHLRSDSPSCSCPDGGTDHCGAAPL